MPIPRTVRHDAGRAACAVSKGFGVDDSINLNGDGRRAIDISVMSMFARDTEYIDLGGDYFIFIERAGKARATRRLISHLGYQVTLQPLEAA